LNVVLKAVGVIQDNLTQCIQEEVLLLGLTLGHQLENLVKEELRVANRYFTQGNRSGLPNVFACGSEVVLQHLEDISLRHINEFTEFTEAESALDLLFGVSFVIGEPCECLFEICMCLVTINDNGET